MKVQDVMILLLKYSFIYLLLLVAFSVLVCILCTDILHIYRDTLSSGFLVSSFKMALQLDIDDPI